MNYVSLSTFILFRVSGGGSVPNEFGEIMDAVNLLTFGSQKVINLYLFVLCRVKDVKNDKINKNCLFEEIYQMLYLP